MPSASTTPTKALSILGRAKRLGAGLVLATIPIAASATTLTLDYSRVGGYSSSGWFMGIPGEAGADGTIIPGGFKLWGSNTISDADFWRTEQNGERYRRSDYSGMVFFWSGKVVGDTTSQDRLSAPFDFTLDFTKGTEDANSGGVNLGLRMGYSTSLPFDAEADYNQSVPGWSSNWSESFYDAGTYHRTGTMSSELPETMEGTDDLYWYAALTVDWYGGHYLGTNDTLTVTIPQNSIDVTYVPHTPDVTPPTSVPDTGSTLSLFGLALGTLAWLRRRR